MLTKTGQYKLKRALLRAGIVLAVVLVLLTAAAAVLFGVNRFSLLVIPVGEQEMVLSPGDSFIDPGAEARLVGTLFFQRGIPVHANITRQGGVDPSTAGDYTVRYTAKLFRWEGKGERSVHVIDNRAPTITLTSIPGYYTIPGEAYVEEGFSAYDDYDGDLTDRVERVEKDGFVTYTVSDSSGNRAQVRRKIHYYDPVPPQITLQGEQTVSLNTGESYTEPGFTASDNCDGDITELVSVAGEVNGYVSGTYKLDYTVSDSTGNTTTVSRTVVVNPKPQPETVTPDGKIIYLTFDDGPSQYTEQLLDVLAKYNVKATFFVINSGYTDVLKRMAEEGHSIGIHSVTHDYKAIYADADTFFSELRQMQSIIQEKAGITTTLVRFPGGSSNTVSCFNPGIMTRLTQAVEDSGYQYFDWNVDSNDAGGAKTADTVFKNVTNGVSGRTISIVLQHDTKGFSVEAVERIISWGIANGYTFLPLEPTSPGAHHGVNN